MIQEKERLCRNIEKREDIYSRISQKIWEYAELGFKEHRSAKLLQETLEREGFQVETGLAGIPTAFKGTFGSGGPVIAILGEFDALPGLSQKPGTDVQEKREDTATDAGIICWEPALLQRLWLSGNIWTGAGHRALSFILAVPGRKKAPARHSWHGRDVLKGLMLCSAGIPGM